MDEETKRAERAIDALMLTNAIQALMASHPAPDRLRQAWDQGLAVLWADHSAVMAGRQNPLTDRMLALQRQYESHIGRLSA